LTSLKSTNAARWFQGNSLTAIWLLFNLNPAVADGLRQGSVRLRSSRKRSHPEGESAEQLEVSANEWRSLRNEARNCRI
jgi:hypothetical protein